MRGAVLLVLVAGAIGGRAATMQWSVGLPVSNRVVQIVTDGSGGCACLMVRTNSPMGVLWVLNKVPRLSWMIVVSNVTAGGVAACTPTQVVYGDANPDLRLFVAGVKMGRVTVQAAAGTYNTVLGLYPLLVDTMSDKKGFFTVVAATNMASSVLVRYTYK